MNRQAGITDQQVDTYCQCYADAMAKQMTVEDITYLAKNNRPSVSLQEKADKIAPTCTRSALGR
jgi:hypothetical protein